MDSYKVWKSGPLNGDVVISGAKNAVLPVLAATLLADGVSEITNVPRLKDVKTMCNVMRVLGMKIDSSPGALKLDSSNVTHLEAPYELVKTMRASIYVLGPLVARFGKARVSLPGGCAWGPRPVDLHIKGMEALGAHIEVKHGYIEATCDRLQGAEINFPISSVGATANILMATTLAKGTSVLNNAAMEPEITALCDYLIGMGAKISGVGTKTLIIEGVETLNPGKGKTIPDRIEAGTFLVGGAITRGRVKITNAEPKDLKAVLEVLEQMGCALEVGDDYVVVDARDCELKPVNVITNPHPAFPTDMQAQFMALLSTVPGTCIVQDNIYHDRFSHMSELQRLGADIALNENSATINGGADMSGAPVMASDLRASAALVLAGLVAEGETEISRIYHMDRGYEYFEKKITGLGGKIERIVEG
ncbi:MAG: UDP-N-acetylglucosamine 1-carboxyvinyltransferase [Fibrobacterales bacterium]